MSTAKEKVLAYFEEWGGVENPANDYAIHHFEDDHSERIGICFGDTCILDFARNEKEDKYWQAAARILKLDKPKAAEIQWREANEFHHVGEGYSVEKFAELGWAAYFGADRIHERPTYFPTLEAAKRACQDHKQKRLEELL